MSLPGLPTIAEKQAHEILYSKDAAEFEATIKEVSELLAEKGMCFVGAFGRLTEDSEGKEVVHLRTRMMGTTEKTDETLALMWAGLRELERTRQQMQEMAVKNKVDLNKFLGAPFVAEAVMRKAYQP